MYLFTSKHSKEKQRKCSSSDKTRVATYISGRGNIKYCQLEDIYTIIIYSTIFYRKPTGY